MDFRLNNLLDNVLDSENLKSNEVDMIKIAGGVKPLVDSSDKKLLMDSMNISIKDHLAKKLILVNHEDCKAYDGVNFEKESHARDLSIAKEMLREHFPEVEVNCYYLLLDGSCSKL
jgi:carbonic anhydrase